MYFSSGGAVYAPKHDRVRYRETDVCAPLSSYGIQKLAAEHYLRLAAFRGLLTATVLRVGNAYGTLLPQHRMQGLIGVAINCVVHNRPVRVFGNPANVRDYIHLDELCNLAERVARPVEEFSIVNVGSGTRPLGDRSTGVDRVLLRQCDPGSDRPLLRKMAARLGGFGHDEGATRLRVVSDGGSAHWNSGHDGGMASRTRTHESQHLSGQWMQHKNQPCGFFSAPEALSSGASTKCSRRPPAAWPPATRKFRQECRGGGQERHVNSDLISPARSPGSD